MECPHCHQRISGKKCPNCGVEIPLESLYCMRCGAETGFEEALTHEEDEFDPDNRILCPDGTCTGIIVDGKCIECGRAYTGEE